MLKKNKIILDKYDYHEALDRTFVCVTMIENVLLNHQVFKKHKKLRKGVKKAQKILYDIYQETGNINFNHFQDTENE